MVPATMMRTASIALTLALLAGCGTGASLAFNETPTPTPTDTRPPAATRTPTVPNCGCCTLLEGMCVAFENQTPVPASCVLVVGPTPRYPGLPSSGATECVPLATPTPSLGVQIIRNCPGFTPTVEIINGTPYVVLAAACTPTPTPPT